MTRPATDIDPAPPGQGFAPGYLVAGVSTLGLILTAPAQTMLVSLLNVPLRETFAVQATALNGSYAAATILASLPLVYVGGWTDRLGPRRMLMVVALAFGGACAFTASLSHAMAIPVAFFLLRFLGQGSLALVSSHLLAMWFHRRLGTIQGVRQVALFAAWAGLPALTSLAIAELGWRTTWAIFAALVPAILLPLAFWVVRDSPEELGLTLDGEPPAPDGERHEAGHTLAQAWRTRAFWVLMCANALAPMIGTAMLFDMQPLLAARAVPISLAPTVVGAWSAAMATLALPTGWLVDRLPPGPLLTGGLALLAGSCLAWLLPGGVGVAIAAMVCFAAGQLLSASLVATATARFYGRAHHGEIRSSLTRVGVIATGCGPLVFGLAQDHLGGFDIALLGFAAICLPVAIAALWLRAPEPLTDVA